MANRRFNQFTFSSVPAPVHIYCQVTIGATGAPTLLQTGGFVSGIVRNGAGDYTVTLVDQYNKLLGLEVAINSGSSAPAAPEINIQAESVASAKTLQFVCRAAGVATDPASGEKLYIIIKCQNSTAQ
jgi:hypothetical protein